ncbi:MAG: LPS assembly protein LptD, partial [Luteolibacter sp.]
SGTCFVSLACAMTSMGMEVPNSCDAPVDIISPVPAPEVDGINAASIEMPEELRITNQGGKIIGNAETGLELGGPVKIIGDNGIEMFSDTASLDLQAKTVTLNGNVRIYQKEFIQRGQSAIYHYQSKRLDTQGLRASVDSILMEADRFSSVEVGGRQVLTGENAGVTTQDIQSPDFWLRASRTRIFPDEKITFSNLRLYAFGVPVFWLPYLAQPLDPELGYHFTPGARTHWGPFLLNRYGMMLGGERDPLTGENQEAWLLSRWHFDIRTRRGLGTGLDLVDTRVENLEEISGLSLYYLNDLDPNLSRSGAPRGYLNEDRFKIELKHRHTFSQTGDATWLLDSKLTWLSDVHYLEDLDVERYRVDPFPDNTLGLSRRDESSLLSLFARFRVNDFYRADTRYPELVYDRSRTSFFDTPILYEGSASLSYIGERPSDITRSGILRPLLDLPAGSPEAAGLLRKLGGYEQRLAQRMLALPAGSAEREAILTQLLDSGYGRFHTWHGWSLPFQSGDFISFVPEAGLGYTRYGAVEGPEEGFGKSYAHIGAEASMKFSKNLGNYHDYAIGLDGLMHVVQPYAAWSLISTDDYQPGHPGVDRLTPTTRPSNIDPLRFPATDQLESWNVLRMGARNRLLTRRDNQSFEWLFMDTYLDAFVDAPEDDREFSNLYNDLRWFPVPWLSLNVESQFPIASSGSGFNEVATSVGYMPDDDFEIRLGYRWLDGHPFLIDSNLLDLNTYIRLSEYWGIGTRHQLEFDDGTLEFQQYTLHRDMGSWVAGIGLSGRDNRLDREYGLVFSLTLKEFPSVSLPFEIDAQ